MTIWMKRRKRSGAMGDFTVIDQILNDGGYTYNRFDGDASNMFYQDTAATIPSGLGDPVRYIVSQTPTGQVFNYQRWDSDQPASLVDLDGYKAIQGGLGFDTDVNTLSIPLTGKSWSWFTVVEGADLTSDGGVIFAVRNNVAGGYMGSGVSILTPDTLRFHEVDAILNVGNKVDFPGFDTSGRFVLTMINSPDNNLNVWRNGVKFVTDAAVAADTGYGRARIHRAFAEGFPSFPYKVTYDGRTPAHISINGGVTMDERQSIEAQLMAYYGIT